MTSPIRPVIGNTDCCFNHAIGLPTKYVSEVGEDAPLRLFDYEKMLYQRLYQYKHLWIKKATGLGVTEFMLRYMAISMPLPLPNVGSWSKEVAEKEKQSLRRANVYIIKWPGPNYFFKFQKKKTYKYLSVGESSPNPFRLEMWNNDPKYIKSYRSYVD